MQFFVNYQYQDSDQWGQLRKEASYWYHFDLIAFVLFKHIECDIFTLSPLHFIFALSFNILCFFTELMLSQLGNIYGLHAANADFFTHINWWKEMIAFCFITQLFSSNTISVIFYFDYHYSASNQYYL